MMTLLVPDPRRRIGHGQASQFRLPQLHRRLTPPLGGPTAPAAPIGLTAPSRSRRSQGGPPRAAIA
ncbi:MAG TPA: hypothetical protein VFQ74_06245 [Pseudolysinimonas sp.]|nr:hypothetical protein [Pseudolysinimonas sp.]